MSRGKHSSVGRCLAVWLLVTVGALATLLRGRRRCRVAGLVRGVARHVRGAARRGRVGAPWWRAWRGRGSSPARPSSTWCAAGCRPRHREDSPAGWCWRRVAQPCWPGSAVPRWPAPSSGDHSLVGLPMPDRAVADRVARSPGRHRDPRRSLGRAPSRTDHRPGRRLALVHRRLRARPRRRGGRDRRGLARALCGQPGRDRQRPRPHPTPGSTSSRHRTERHAHERAKRASHSTATSRAPT